VGQAPPAPWSYTDIGDYVLDERRLGVYSAVAIQTPGATSHEAASGRFTARGDGTDLNVIGQGMTVHFAPRAGHRRLRDRGARGEPGERRYRGPRGADHDQHPVAVRPHGRRDPHQQGTGDVGVKQFVRRQKVAGGFVSTDRPAAVGVPTWLRLERVERTFTASSSSDGQAWTPIAPPDEIAAFGDAPYHVGLAVVSREPLKLNATVFRQRDGLVTA